MKIVSVLVFALAMVGSWVLVNSKKPVPESVHAGIQTDLKKIIAEYVQKNRPESKNLRFQRFWTETLNPTKVRATFMYSFDDTAENGDSAEVILEGTAILNKIQETPEMITWSFDELKILGNTVNFSEPIQITAGKGSAEDENESAPEKTAPQQQQESHHN